MIQESPRPWLLALLLPACAGGSTMQASSEVAAPQGAAAAPTSASAAAATVSAPAVATEMASTETSASPPEFATSRPAPPRGGVCSAADEPSARQAFDHARGFRNKVQREEHPTHEEYRAGLADLRVAAEAGLLEAQFEYAVTVIGMHFMDHAPVPSEESDYVSAVQFVRAAARRGHAGALKDFPELGEAKLPKKLDGLLKELPRAWVEAAVAKGDAWLRKCESAK